MAKKIDDIYADLIRYVNKFENAIDERVAQAVGFTVRQRMLDLVRKGISPILGAGRFPEYKAAKNLRTTQNLIRSAKANAESPGRSRAVLARAKQKKARLQRGYPYSTEEYKRGLKKARPVNLTLTGAFLSSLTFGFGSAGKKMRVVIGFFDPKQAIKEKGHREGANGQPKRPIIPKGNQKFNETIRLDILGLLRDAVRKATKRAG